jgi:hypothetical protein
VEQREGRHHNKELYNLYPSPNISRMTISRRMTLALRIAPLGSVGNGYIILIGNLRSTELFEDLGLVESILLKWILKKYGGLD